MSVGVNFEIIQTKDLLVGSLKYGEVSLVFRNDSSFKQFTLFNIFASSFQNEKKCNHVIKRLQSIKHVSSLPLLHIDTVYQTEHQIFILCNDSFSFEDRMNNKITSDEARYFLADFRYILQAITILPAHVSSQSLVFMQDSISTCFKSRCDSPSSPIPHLLLSPLAFVLPMTILPNMNITKTTPFILSLINDIVSKVIPQDESDTYFIGQVMKFIQNKELVSLEELSNSEFLFRCYEFQQLPHGSLDNYTPLEFIGNGAFGLVVKVERDGVIYAMKQSSRADILQREARAMKLLSHPNLMSLVDYIESSESFVSRLGIKANRSKMYYYLVMEYCNFGTLAQYINTHDLKEEDIVYFISQINDGLKYLLYKKMMVHRDIKLDNVLLTTIPGSKAELPFNLQVKLADYGFCRAINSGIEHVKVGTPLYLGPEIYNNSSPSLKSDLYSVGVMLFRMVCGCFPNEINTSQTLRNENPHVVFPQKVNNDTHLSLLRNLISRLIQKESIRIDWNSYFNHPFFVHC
ncbi:protein kinase domain containing protein [Entamoeba histolytica HM-1:IMSS-B]|uniref:Protein kinase domain containing protein n=6 Tax=Entamoeba histolytica TaxID=5759 RepID=C4LVE5_ENTH1|nr:protein kinase domain containing protein [Entamoeba histolytica HM-1:IMSS]EMD43449.1 serine/threonine protein kinase, putative [Entamoeba histolytica KU27]EMH77443.1 protein kinase domain containing protein [Entamoeba histolytica HM-1:IMSS-B]EMS16111.1 serine/threonine protein kinase SAPK10, putative [Entamoeba histolytica HM-3:IMSS]ENY63050.1 serine/threonine protein kinase SAPK10, putative [Entamoeba histolytica HM-1:IMSS-A]EAL48601.1 protein kinase domain containing protein [Entamoeba hi|eukprot:XP_653987.1 protein kinase domain containing protein [Entamoeba histolytica HM-1:IMSS]